ncbi:MAG: DUF695 domain-containing protein [Flavobacteriaceae bacterium]|nr:DUF695 domain-containing protein [Flavobacteriaceae bacterium]
MKQIYFPIVFLLVISLSGFTQNSKEDWVTYTVQKEKGPMVITTNLYYNFMGKPNYKNLLVVGTSTRDCKKNGFPDELGLSKFYLLSDSIAVKLDRLTKKRLVGIITYQCSGLDVYYLKDTIGVKNTLQSYLDYNYALSKNYLLLNYDKKWKYYREELVPKDISDAFFITHEILNQLVIEGDNLKQPRKINHWVNFRNKNRRQRFIEEAKKLRFAVDSIKEDQKGYYRFRAVISRKDSVKPEIIVNLSKLMMKFTGAYSGVYNGWYAEPIIED